MSEIVLSGSTAVFPPVVDKTTATGLGEALGALRKKTVTEFDLSKVESFDAAGLELLASSKKTFPDAKFSSPSETIRRLVSDLGASSLFEGAP